MHEPLANQQVPAYILNVEGLTPCGVLRQHGFALADALQDDGEWLPITLSERARGPAGDTVFDPMAGMSIAQMRPSPRAAHAQPEPLSCEASGLPSLFQSQNNFDRAIHRRLFDVADGIRVGYHELLYVSGRR